MFSFIKGLFGSSTNTTTVVETAAKGIYNGFNALVFTAQEKAEFNERAGNAVIKFAEIAYDENSIRSITRRWLAFLVVGPTMLFATVAAICFPFALEYANFLLILSGKFIPWAGGVLVFYFGPHLLGALQGRKKDE